MGDDSTHEQAYADSPEHAQEFEMNEGEEDDLFDNNGQDLIDKNLQEGDIKYGDDDGDDDDHVQSEHSNPASQWID